jgi:hypothetical protein
MSHRNAPERRVTRRTPGIGRGAALALALAASLAQPADAERLAAPPVPPDLEVEAGSRAFLVGHAAGTQNYICLPAGSGFAWTLFTPEATLFSGQGRQLATHFFSPNPIENGAFRPAWQHSRDTSIVWARLDAQSSDPAFVAPGAIPWFLLEVAGAGEGPHGGDALGATTQIQRLNTSGGVAPSTGCSASTDIGKKAFVPYTADYFFYSLPGRDEGRDD